MPINFSDRDSDLMIRPYCQKPFRQVSPGCSIRFDAVNETTWFVSNRGSNCRHEALLPEPQARTNDLYAVSGDASVIQLFSRGHTVAAFRLPEYDNWLTTKKFFLFPLAAAADAAAVGAVAGAAAGVGSLDGVSFRFP